MSQGNTTSLVVSGGSGGDASNAQIAALETALSNVIVSEGDETQADLVTLIASMVTLQNSNVSESDATQVKLDGVITALSDLKASNIAESTGIKTGITDSTNLLTSLESILAALKTESKSESDATQVQIGTLETLLSTMSTTLSDSKVEAKSESDATQVLLSNMLADMTAPDTVAVKASNTLTANSTVPAGARQVTIVNTGNTDITIDGDTYPSGTVFTEESWEGVTLPSYTITVPSTGTPKYILRTLT